MTPIPFVGPAPITIVMYHAVDPEPDPHDPYALTPDAFERQIACLARHYPLVRLTDLLSPEGWAGRNRRVIVTFDDGWQNFREFAFPVLERYGVPVTMFVPTRFVGKNGVMSPGELRKLQETGVVEFGSHTANHLRMGLLPIAEMRRQAYESKAELEAMLGVPTLTFAYPFGQRGDFSRASTRILAEAGYRLAVTACWGTRNSPARLLRLKRIHLMEYDDGETVRAKIEGAYDWLALKETGAFVIREAARSLQTGFCRARRLMSRRSAAALSRPAEP